MEKKRKIGLPSIDTQILAERLLKAEMDELISYAEMRRLVGRNVQSEARGNVNTARKMAMDTGGIFFEVVPNEGLRRITQSAWVKRSPRVALERQRRSSHRILHGLRCVTDDLDAEAQRDFNVHSTMHGTLMVFLKPKSIERVASGVSKANAKLSVEATLGLFRSKE